jgi:peptidoglycan LD-endopeptidase LytH
MHLSATRTTWLALLAVLAAAALAGCQAGFPLGDVIRPASPHEQYARAMRQAGLDDTALGLDWIAAGERALRAPVHVALPFSEIAYLSPAEPSAIAYRVELRRGQRFVLDVTHDSPEPSRLFIDVFSDATGTLRRETSAESGADGLHFDPPRDDVYLVRLQPELLRGGRYRIDQRVTASLAFPVEGRDTRAVGSGFGMPRDGGAREHHGLDIFAPRGTRVVSATDGRVSRVDDTGRGGRIVWVWDPDRRLNLYYAHLDEQLVSQGQQVRAGDPIGTVGNTGNARGTPPHLHFGIYRRGAGPVDPLPYVHEPRTGPRPVTASLDPLGTWHRTAANYRLRAGASTASGILADLPRHTALRVDGVTTEWYRVALADGRRGFVHGAGLQPVDIPIGRHQALADTPVHLRPDPAAALVGSVEPGGEMPVLGRHGDYAFVRTADGREGWSRLE